MKYILNKRPIIKSVLILALTVLTIYQISQLWFVDFTNRNFFLYVRARFAPQAGYSDDAWARPLRIVYGSGDGQFGVLYSGIADNEMFLYNIEIVAELFRNGMFVERHDSWQCIAQRPVILFEYNFEMNVDFFAEIVSTRSAWLLTSQGLTYFDAIAVFPPQTAEGSVHIYFMNDGAVWEFALAPRRRDNFLFTVPNGATHIFEGGFFSRGFYQPYVIVHNPFLSQYGLLHMSSIRPRIEHFFTNPATIHSRLGNEFVYTFSNRNTMVRYMPFGVLEYTSYRIMGRTAPANILSDFSAALAFMSTDPNLTNEVFLTAYEVHGGVHLFKFDLVVDNFPLQLASPWYTGPNCRDPLNAMIEITVDRGRIVRYRRLAHSFVVEDRLWVDEQVLMSPVFVFSPAGIELVAS